MKEGYIAFFTRASEIYGSSGGHSRLLNAINSEELKDGLDERKYEIAKNVLLNFFNGRNTNGNNRIFGIGDFEINQLVKTCLEMS